MGRQKWDRRIFWAIIASVPFFVERQYALIAFPYLTTPDERNQVVSHFAREAEQQGPVLGIAAIGVNLASPHYPYDFLAYIPGHADGAFDFTPLVPTKRYGPAN